MTLPRFLSLLCIAALSGCSDEPETPAREARPETPAPVSDAPPPDVSHEETEVTFRCTDGSEFTATFGSEVVWLKEGEQEQELRQQPAESGERYTGDGHELILRDDQAVLVVGEDTRDCTRLEAKQLSLPGSARDAEAG